MTVMVISSTSAAQLPGTAYADVMGHGNVEMHLLTK